MVHQNIIKDIVCISSTVMCATLFFFKVYICIFAKIERRQHKDLAYYHAQL